MTDMLAGFGLYVIPTQRGDHNTIATPLGTRLKRIERLPCGWRLWTSTTDFRYGTYLELFDDGRILNVTTRVDEGDDMFWSRPSDEETRSRG